MSGKFEQINALAIKLGNQLPGTSADFMNMMATLKQFGMSDESILSGVGDAAARIGVLLKLTPEAAAEFVSKMKTATGTADEDMLGLMDTIQRVFHLGVKSDEMMMAFARSGGALKTFGIQGLQASKELAPIFAMLVKGGLSGETIGTGFASILNQVSDAGKMGKVNAGLAKLGVNLRLFDKKGQFLGPQNLVAQFDQLKKLNPQQLSAVLKEITGGGQDQQMLASIVTNGLTGYQDMERRMQEQADLQARVNVQLGTLKNLWDAASGTFTNALAAFAESFAPELKALTAWFGRLAESVGNFSKEHPMLSKTLGIMIGGFALVTIGLGAMALLFAGVLKYIALVSG
ncbi:MAG: phage tail tape measure protein, partial [Chloroflexota bacterium]